MIFNALVPYMDVNRVKTGVLPSEVSAPSRSPKAANVNKLGVSQGRFWRVFRDYNRLQSPW